MKRRELLGILGHDDLLILAGEIESKFCAYEFIPVGLPEASQGAALQITSWLTRKSRLIVEVLRKYDKLLLHTRRLQDAILKDIAECDLCHEFDGERSEKCAAHERIFTAIMDAMSEEVLV